RLKAMGFSDKRLARLAARSTGVRDGMRSAAAEGTGLVHDVMHALGGGVTEAEVRALRQRLEVHPVFKRIDTCAAEFEAKTPYMYSTYEAPVFGAPECEAQPSD